jgi:glycerol uptake facilitator-like aquaporin
LREGRAEEAKFIKHLIYGSVAAFTAGILLYLYFKSYISDTASEEINQETKEVRGYNIIEKLQNFKKEIMIGISLVIVLSFLILIKLS